MAGEFEILQKIRHWLPKIGDDCARLLTYENKSSKHKILIASTDAFVEDVHFEKKYFSYYDIGYKSLAASISDVAACGGIPKWNLISLGIPKGDIKIVREVYEGMKDVCEQYGGTIVGGDTVFSKKMFVNATVIGETERFISRKGAKKGDILCVTGVLGGASAGLVALKKRMNSNCINKQLIPTPRVKEGKLLVKYASSMIDISDGLIIDLSHILEESNVAAKVFRTKLPVCKRVKDIAKAAKIPPEKFVLGGGEDYELLFTIPKRLINRAKKEVKFTEIGEIIEFKEEQNRIIDETNKAIHIQGFTHFR